MTTYDPTDELHRAAQSVRRSYADRARIEREAADAELEQHRQEVAAAQAALAAAATPEERTARIRELDEAARVSREIDDEIARDRRAYERRKKAIKILLLGACPPSSLSRPRRRRPRPGRVREEHDAQECVLPSSLRECCSRPADFQLAFSPQHFHKERSAWKTIIQLNLIRYVPVSVLCGMRPLPSRAAFKRLSPCSVVPLLV